MHYSIGNVNEDDAAFGNALGDCGQRFHRAAAHVEHIFVSARSILTILENDGRWSSMPLAEASVLKP